MNRDKYVAYVSTYTSGNKSSCGIRIYDVDMKMADSKKKTR